MKKIRRGLIYILCVLLFQEVVFRVCFQVPEVTNFNRVNYQFLENHIYHDPDLFLENRTWQSSLDTNKVFLHSFNEYGFRDGPWKLKKEKGKKRIVFIGDSFVEGVMSDLEQSIPKCYEKLAGEKVEVYNAGMNGTGLENYLKLIRDIVPIFKPEELKLILYSNDFGVAKTKIPNETSLVPEYSSRYMPRILAIVQRLISGKKIVFRWGRLTQPFLYPVPESSNPFSSKGHLLKKEVSPKVREAMKEATFNYYVINLLYKETQSLKRPMSLHDELAFVKKICLENNTKLSVYYIPSRNQVTDEYLKYDKESCLLKCKEQVSLTTAEYQIHAETLNRDCDQLGISFLDLTPIIREKEKKNNLYWNYDEHMRDEGYKLVAEEMYNNSN